MVLGNLLILKSFVDKNHRARLELHLLQIVPRFVITT
jgi:hypothetical protein